MMRITINSVMTIDDPEPTMTDLLAARLRFINPKWTENDRMGRWNGNTPKFISFCTQTPSGSLILPRGYARRLLILCRQTGLPHTLADERRRLPECDFQFSGTLKSFQEEASRQVLRKEFGVLCAPTGSGKTVIALYVIAMRRQPSLILVHTRDLAHQWRERIQQFLGIPLEEIGLISGGKYRIGDRISVGTVQSVYRCAGEAAPHIGHLLVDECHRAPSRTFTEAVTAFDARYMLGLSATPWRRDGLSRLIFWHLGDLQHTVEPMELSAQGQMVPLDIIRRETAFETRRDPVHEYPKVIAELTANDDRNRLIAGDVAREAASGASILVLSDRKRHCLVLQALLSHAHHVTAEILTGDVSPKDRAELTERLARGQVQVVVATGQLVGEGFDCGILSVLFIVTPIRFSGRLLQYMGRVLRPSPQKQRARIFDYIDARIAPLAAAAEARSRVYEHWQGPRAYNPQPDDPEQGIGREAGPEPGREA